jgi:hypothetical protein
VIVPTSFPPPPLNPLLTLPPSSMALKPLTPPLLPPGHPSPVPPGPYKRVMRPPRPSPHHIPSFPSFFVPSSTLATSSSRCCSLPPVHRLVATPPSPVSTLLAPPRPARPPPPSPVSSNARAPCAGEAPLRPLSAVHCAVDLVNGISR